ncbi:MAG: DNA repair protein RecO [Lysobacterales bacterium]
MRVESEPGHVLHARPWRETSLLVEALTATHGRVGLVARGVRTAKRAGDRGLLQPLRPLLFGWSAHGELGTLGRVEAGEGPVVTGTEAVPAALYVNELVLRTSARNDPHADLYAAYVTCLDRLARDADIAWTLRRFERDLFAALGYGLALQRTADAGTAIRAEGEYAWDPASGATEWAAGSPAPRISGRALIALDTDCRPEARELAELRRLSRVVIRHLIGGELASWSTWPAVRPAGNGRD